MNNYNNGNSVPLPPDPNTGNSVYQPNQQNQQINPFSKFMPQNQQQQYQQNEHQKHPNMIHPQMPNIPPQSYENAQSSEISPLIHNEYGEKFHRTQRTTPNGYQSCLRACGSCAKCFCCLCITCECGPMQIIPPGHVGLLSEFGMLKKKIGPGPKYINPCTETVQIVSIKKQAAFLPPQDVLTSDHLKLTCSAGCNYDFTNVELAYLKLQDFNTFLSLTIQGELKSVVSSVTLQELKENTLQLSKKLQEELEKKFSPYGIRVIEVYIRDIRLPYEMERAMAAVAESKQENEMKKNAALGYLKSAQDYKKAAESYKGNNIAMELKYFSILQAITMGKKSTVLMRDCIINMKELKKD